MICKKCGKQNPDHVRFCGACGTPVYTASDGKIVSVGKKKTLPVKKLLVCAVSLAVVAVVIILASSLFGKKTVWLVTKEVWREGSIKDVVAYAYDEQGRLVEYKDDLGELRYIYENNRIVEAEGDRDLYLEYGYDRKGNLETVEGDGFEAEVTCDKNGRVLEMEFEGDRNLSIEYSYHDNGCIREAELREGDYRYIWSYSASGKILEKVIYYSGELYSTYAYEYDSEDRLLEYTIEKHMIGFSVTECWEYDKKGNWVGYVMRYDGEDVIECEVTGDSTTREAVVTWASVDFIEEGDTYIEETYDKYGNLIEQVTYGDQKVKITWEYEKRKVSPENVINDIYVDPRFCLFLN